MLTRYARLGDTNEEHEIIGKILHDSFEWVPTKDRAPYMCVIKFLCPHPQMTVAYLCLGIPIQYSLESTTFLPNFVNAPQEKGDNMKM